MLRERYESLTQDEVKRKIANGEAILLDVRTEEEYDECHLKDSVHIPLHELEFRVEELEEDKTYITFCRSGVRSKAAVVILMDKGFEHVYNSLEGISTWK